MKYKIPPTKIDTIMNGVHTKLPNIVVIIMLTLSPKVAVPSAIFRVRQLTLDTPLKLISRIAPDLVSEKIALQKTEITNTPNM
jgi:hypothetical protein